MSTQTILTLVSKLDDLLDNHRKRNVKRSQLLDKIVERDDVPSDVKQEIEQVQSECRALRVEYDIIVANMEGLTQGHANSQCRTRPTQTTGPTRSSIWDDILDIFS